MELLEIGEASKGDSVDAKGRVGQMKFSEFVTLVDELVSPFGLVKLPRQINCPTEQAGWKTSDTHVRLFFDTEETKPVRLAFSRIEGALIVPDKGHYRFNLKRDNVLAVAQTIFHRLQQKVGAF